MATLLEQRLDECCVKDLAVGPLVAQWRFDKILIGKALQNVGNLFPHYSRHDESHSTQILVNIERILGASRISQLSGSDVWLLLEAAYLHDIGMVVTQQEKELDWKSDDFRTFVASQQKRTNEKYSLNELLGDIADPIEAIAKNGNPLEKITSISQILAEYYRQKHADRAARIVSQPVTTIGLNSPRNELIPQRLFYLLGDICAMHGKGHAELMQLPAVASGLGKDKIHPRFVACMLRLGDLLDLDDNRFCPVMLEVAGQLPASTHAHIDKHLAIRHLRIDAERIEAHAVCSTYDGYVESEKWFDYLRKEIAWQMAHWADISPDNRFGLLPTIGKITTELKGYELIDNASRPQFELDHPRVMELLQGAGLYTSHRDVLRELLQNAIDATLLYAWLRHGEGEVDDLPDEMTIRRQDSPYDQKVIKILNEYPIEITITRPISESTSVPSAVTIKIRDNGVGISRDDLKGMSKIGRSSRGSWKNAVFERMPTWMRPSGAFGIGLQSGFTLTDEILYVTKSVISGEQLLIRMSNPVGPEEGSIYVQRQKSCAVAKPCGTILELNIPLEKEREFGIQRGAYEFFDPIIGKQPLYFEGILDNAPIPVAINGIPQPRIYSELDWEYHPDVSVAVAFNFKSPSDGLRLYFKGQRVGYQERMEYFPCEVHVNIFGQARSLLKINRNELRASSVVDKLVPSIVSTAKNLLAKCEESAEKAMLSATLLALAKPCSDDYLEMMWETVGDYGRRRLIFAAEQDKPQSPTMRSMIKGGMDLYQAFGDYSPRYVFFDGSYRSCTHDSISIFFQAIVHQGLKGYIKSVTKKGVIVGISTSKDAWDAASLVDLLLANLTPGLRLALPVTSRFKKLGSVTWSKWVGELSCGILCPGRDYMYSPFFVENESITTRNLEKLIEWTFKNRNDPTVSLEDVRNSYRDFIRYVDEAMQGRPEWTRARLA
ncbi:ATP-binding protein [Alcaligenaceae bacterium CGII-47]|nr:ATP-binding protein [Alcaligenaceae bacterium CGII-47]